MDEKKEIGKKIWDLFLKNYSYREIANKLGVSKSLVSNVINYTLPTHNWIDEDIRKLKQKYEQETQKLKKELKEKEEEYKELNETFENFLIIVLITLSIYLIATSITLFFVKINFYHHIWYALGFIVYSIIFLIIILFAVAYVRVNEWI